MNPAGRAQDEPINGGKQPSLKRALTKPHLMIAQCLGVGLAPVAPGTFGTMAGFAMFALFGLWDMPIRFAGYAIVLAISVWAVARAGKELGEHDHQSIVIDEMLAMCLVLEVAPSTNLGWAAAFVLFRIFDIWKPWPIGPIDRKVNNAFGVMLDDLAAAVYAGLILAGAQYANLL